MNFSIITPSLNQLHWLQLCVASVADQQSECEHLVQDGSSQDGTPEWIKEHPNIRDASERDAGMYDAINKGLRRANGEILAILNSDEQYLPGTLRAVELYFGNHPEVDVLFADAVVTDDTGNYRFHRKVVAPRGDLDSKLAVGGSSAIIFPESTSS